MRVLDTLGFDGFEISIVDVITGVIRNFKPQSVFEVETECFGFFQCFDCGICDGTGQSRSGEAR